MSDMSRVSILHIDADSFFASVEQAIHPEYRGKPVVTGRERGIASAMSYEAKAHGVTRGMPVGEVRRVCPQAIIVASDYETYSIFSRRMFEIVRRYTPTVEEYSIDECFADLSHAYDRACMHSRAVAVAIKRDLEVELGVPFSLGCGSTKVRAKVASKQAKPGGLVCIANGCEAKYFVSYPVDDIWGIGPQTALYLRQHGVETAGDLMVQHHAWVYEHLSKPYREIWHELQGVMVYPVDPYAERAYQSVRKTKTFTPPSSDHTFLFSQLSYNVENACIKLRRHGLRAHEATVLLKTQEFHTQRRRVELPVDTASPAEIVRAVEPAFEAVWKEGVLYRATGIVLHELTQTNIKQEDLFGEREQCYEKEKLYRTIDAVDGRYGKHTVFLGSSFQVARRGWHAGDRGGRAWRTRNTLPGESARKRLSIPYLGEVT